MADRRLPWALLQNTLGRLEQSLADTEGGLAAAQEQGKRVADSLAAVDRATVKAKNDLQVRGFRPLYLLPG